MLTEIVKKLRPIAEKYGFDIDHVDSVEFGPSIFPAYTNRPVYVEEFFKRALGDFNKVLKCDLRKGKYGTWFFVPSSSIITYDMLMEGTKWEYPQDKNYLDMKLTYTRIPKAIFDILAKRFFKPGNKQVVVICYDDDLENWIAIHKFDDFYYMVKIDESKTPGS